MGYIYSITNKLNGKKYIGKTVGEIEKRWREHIRDSKKRRCEKRPLYSAMRKYGENNFFVEQIEECSDAKLSEREKYWIQKYNTYKNGYNATLGGDGKIYLDYDEIISLYNELHSVTEVAKKIGCSKDSVSNILKMNNIPIFSGGEVTRKKFSKKIAQFDKNGNYIKTFNSYTEAEYFMGNTQRHICDCANGKRKSAYGFVWKWLE